MVSPTNVFQQDRFMIPNPHAPAICRNLGVMIAQGDVKRAECIVQNTICDKILLTSVCVTTAVESANLPQYWRCISPPSCAELLAKAFEPFRPMIELRAWMEPGDCTMELSFEPITANYVMFLHPSLSLILSTVHWSAVGPWGERDVMNYKSSANTHYIWATNCLSTHWN